MKLKIHSIYMSYRGERIEIKSVRMRERGLEFCGLNLGTKALGYYDEAGFSTNTFRNDNLIGLIKEQKP